MDAAPLMKGEGSGWGQPALTFSFPPAFSSLTRCRRRASPPPGSCSPHRRLLPRSVPTVPLRSPPGPGGLCPLPAPRQHRPFPSHPSPGLSPYLALRLEDQLVCPRFYFSPSRSFQPSVLSLIPRRASLITLVGSWHRLALNIPAPLDLLINLNSDVKVFTCIHDPSL